MGGRGLPDKSVCLTLVIQIYRLMIGIWEFPVPVEKDPIKFKGRGMLV